jgi:hypothetical protein
MNVTPLTGNYPAPSLPAGADSPTGRRPGLPDRNNWPGLRIAVWIVSHGQRVGLVLTGPACAVYGADRSRAATPQGSKIV